MGEQPDPNKYSFLERHKKLDKRVKDSKKHFLLMILLILLIVILYFLYPTFLAAYDIILQGDSIDICVMQAEGNIPAFLESKECDDLINAYIPDELNTQEIEKSIFVLINELREKNKVYKIKRDVDMDLLARYQSKYYDKAKSVIDVAKEFNVDVVAIKEVDAREFYCSFINEDMVIIPIKNFYLTEGDPIMNEKIANLIVNKFYENQDYRKQMLNTESCSVGVAINYDKKQGVIIAYQTFRNFDDTPKI